VSSRLHTLAEADQIDSFVVRRLGPYFEKAEK
jgi:hypothetical protein